MLLTGRKDINMKILNDLDDKDLVNICQVNRKANEICRDQVFWMNRVFSRFPQVDRDKLRNNKGDRSWSDYYIYYLRKLNNKMLVPSRQLVLVTDNMKSFFKNANLGPSNPNDPNSTHLNDILSVGVNSVITTEMLISLFNIYACINKMEKNGIVTSTPDMDKYFKDSYSKNILIDPKNLKPVDFHIIIADNLGKEISSYGNLGVITRIDLEMQLVDGIWSVYKKKCHTSASYKLIPPNNHHNIV